MKKKHYKKKVMVHFHQDFLRVERGYIVSLVGSTNIRERVEALVLGENINGKERRRRKPEKQKM
jgi:hypothetical protein